MRTIPWYKSAIVRQQIVQAITALLVVMGVSLDAVDIDSIVGLVLGGMSVATAVWTVITRLRKPTPPITDEALERTIDFHKRPV